jgi:hypothetical protein
MIKIYFEKSFPKGKSAVKENRELIEIFRNAKFSNMGTRIFFLANWCKLHPPKNQNTKADGNPQKNLNHWTLDILKLLW